MTIKPIDHVGMKIFVNGENIEIRDAKTIGELIESYQLPSQSTLVEHNGCALHRRDWPGQALSEGDRVELVQVAAGG
jgi:thiamine biosynthesis protein ThiS